MTRSAFLCFFFVCLPFPCFPSTLPLPGELMDGRRGLVPSNFVERVSDDDLLSTLPRELADSSHSSGPELSFLSGGGGGCSSGGQSSGGRSQPRPEEETAGDELSLSPPPEGLGEPLAVPYPRHITVLKQLAHSVVLAWELPPERVDLRGFHIFVNGELRQALGPGVPPKAVLENMDLRAGPLHVSVQALTSKGNSDPLRCCLAVGAGAGVVPSQLRIHRLTATSAEITWVPGNSNLAHAIYLNGEECPLARPSTYWATFCNLRPGTLYQARVEAQIPSQGPWEPGRERPEQRAATLQFTTLPAGMIMVSPKPRRLGHKCSWPGRLALHAFSGMRLSLLSRRILRCFFLCFAPLQACPTPH